MTFKFTPRLRIYTLVLAIVWGGFLFTVLVIALPNNTVTPFFLKKKSLFIAVFPQGWGFFTKNPREVRSIFLVKGRSGWIQDPRLRSGTLHNIYGLSRTGRISTMAYQLIMKKTRPSQWYVLKDHEFQSTSVDDPKYKTATIHFKKVPGLDMPKDILIIRRNIVPWAYRDFKDKTGTAVYFVKIRLSYQ